MFDNETTINQFLLGQLSRINADIPVTQFFQPGLGHGHPPVWILGHLAICGEIGVKLLGERLTHPRWLALFGPGSSDQVTPDDSLNPASLIAANIDSYSRFRTLAAQADPQRMQAPHGVDLLRGSGIETIGQLISHLLTSHFAFHLAQLSSCRRAEGHKALF